MSNNTNQRLEGDALLRASNYITRYRPNQPVGGLTLVELHAVLNLAEQALEQSATARQVMLEAENADLELNLAVYEETRTQILTHLSNMQQEEFENLFVQEDGIAIMEEGFPGHPRVDELRVTHDEENPLLAPLIEVLQTTVQLVDADFDAWFETHRANSVEFNAEVEEREDLPRQAIAMAQAQIDEDLTWYGEQVWWYDAHHLDMEE